MPRPKHRRTLPARHPSQTEMDLWSRIYALAVCKRRPYREIISAEGVTLEYIRSVRDGMDELCQLHVDGWPLHQIATRVGLTTAHVRYILRPTPAEVEKTTWIARFRRNEIDTCCYGHA